MKIARLPVLGASLLAANVALAQPPPEQPPPMQQPPPPPPVTPCPPPAKAPPCPESPPVAQPVPAPAPAPAPKAWKLEIYGFNERAIAQAERTGYVREGVRRKAYRKNGEWHDAVLFGLLREELDLPA